MANETYDGILLGAGHNTLILQAYLGRAGLKTVCLERRGVAGGGLSTVEDSRRPGFLHNTHSFYHRAINQMPWYRDLELERLGAQYLEPPLNVALMLRDGRSLTWWTDFERTVDSFARFSSKDAATLRRWRDEFVPILDEILLPGEPIDAPAAGAAHTTAGADGAWAEAAGDQSNSRRWRSWSASSKIL